MTLADIERIDAPEGFIYDPSLVLYLPLHQLDGSFFMERSHYGHLCTVYGATWGTQGRTFDGIDDYVKIAAESVMNFTSGDFSISIWVKPTANDVIQCIFSRGLYDTDGYLWTLQPTGYTHFYTCQSGISQATYSTNTAIVAGAWHHLTVVRSGATVTIYKAGVNITLSHATHIDPVTSARQVKIGVRDDLAWDFTGIMGGAWACNRTTTIAEIQNNYLATKWRYK